MGNKGMRTKIIVYSGKIGDLIAFLKSQSAEQQFNCNR